VVLFLAEAVCAVALDRKTLSASRPGRRGEYKAHPLRCASSIAVVRGRILFLA
jgi:hypothetical protein